MLGLAGWGRGWESGGEVSRSSGDLEHFNPVLCSLDYSCSHLTTDLPLSLYPL